MELALENNVNLNGKNLETKQNKFLNSTMWKVINMGLNTGIRALLPNVIEDEVIKIKDAIINGGFKLGAKQAVSSAIDLGKSVTGIVTGDFDNISQAHNAIKSGGIIDSISGALTYGINKGVQAKLIPNDVGKILKSGKNIIVNTIESNIEKNFNDQLNAAELLGKYENNWQRYFENKDFSGMEREYRKINEALKNIMPMKNTILETEKIKNLHQLVRNKGGNFNLTNEEIELSKRLVFNV